MHTVTVFLTEIFITLVVVFLTLAYLRPFLRRILLDICGTEERAQFWATFTNIVLVSLPLISALGFTPPSSADNLAVEMVHQLKSNLMNFMLGFVLIGFILLFFTASASRIVKREK
jgi:hypothetical protein